MLQTAFGASCMDRASVFEWHKRFKEGRNLLGMMGGVEGVRKSEHQSWLAKWKISWITTVVHSLMSVWELYTQLFTRNWRCGRFERSFSQGALRRSERKTLSWQQEMVRLINSDPAVLDALVTCDESWIYCYDPETKRQSSQWKHAGSPRPKKARQSKSTHKPLMIPFLIALAWSTCTGFPLDRQSTRNTMLRF